MILLILESHRALHFRGCIDESAQRIAGQRVIVAAGVYVIEFGGLVITTLRVRSFEQEAFDFVGGIKRESFVFVKSLRPLLKHAANVGGVRGSAFVDHVAKDQNLSGTEDVSRRPVKRRPIDSEAKIALALRS